MYHIYREPVKYFFICNEHRFLFINIPIGGMRCGKGRTLTFKLAKRCIHYGIKVSRPWLSTLLKEKEKKRKRKTVALSRYYNVQSTKYILSLPFFAEVWEGLVCHPLSLILPRSRDVWGFFLQYYLSEGEGLFCLTVTVYQSRFC